MRWMLVVTLALLATACSKKQEAKPLPVAGESAKAGAKLAYEHHLRIELQEGQLAPRMAALREACESARFGACNVLNIEQSEHNGSLTVRVVPAGVEPLTGMASQDGKLASRQTRAEDLADAVNDNERKLKQLEIYSAQVEQLAQRKDISTSDLIALSHERAQIQVDRENFQNVAAQQQRRIDTNLLQMDFTDETRGHHLGVSLSDSIDQLYEGIRDALEMLAYGLPFLLLAFPLALVWWWFWRRVTRKSRQRNAV
ncbi:DUF4349 domain-containing protein [Dyella choica]|uniref:DUF4349 domain-containing protein n=2 Tax=Dyella choica TaxID=1927959 RepID=A0A3S0RXJ8_9GAMM|nr:DUF4349 domain-containing protein [Dyella choica]